MHIPTTSVPELVWPGIPSQNGAMMMSMLYQFEHSQWWDSETIKTFQLEQLEHLLNHAVQTVPFYKKHFEKADLKFSGRLTVDEWQRVPILEREVLQENEAELISQHIPEHHGNAFKKKTSGSTGRQLNILDTDANNLYWMAITLRDHVWHQREFDGKFVSIRSGRYGKDPMSIKSYEGWGPSTCSVFRTGPSCRFYHTMPIEKQVEVLLDFQPAYLLIYPSNVIRLATYFRNHNLKLDSLRGILTYGELLLPEVRSDCEELWNVPVTDMYSCEELGYIALQCPDCENYHCQSESVLVEVLDENDRQCKPGEAGRLVLTSLHNFAMPFIRYANRDYAEVGEPCSCGRGGLVLKRLLGRERNRAVAPDGKKFWPAVSRETWKDIPEIEELQLAQVGLDQMEVRLVANALTEEDERKLSDLLCADLGYSYQFDFNYQQEIIRHANGKYERFIRKIDV